MAGTFFFFLFFFFLIFFSFLFFSFPLPACLLPNYGSPPGGIPFFPYLLCHQQIIMGGVFLLILGGQLVLFISFFPLSAFGLQGVEFWYCSVRTLLIYLFTGVVTGADSESSVYISLNEEAHRSRKLQRSAQSISLCS